MINQLRFFTTIMAILFLVSCDKNETSNPSESSVTTALKDFQSQDRHFKVTVPPGDKLNPATDDALGTSHGEAPDWNKICGMNDGKTIYLDHIVNSIFLNFQKDKNQVTIILDCSRGGGAKDKTYNFGYDAKASGDDLLIKLDALGQKVEGNFDAGRQGNLLDFFSKADWLYSKKKDELMGISQLGKLGYRVGEPLLDLKNEADFDAAIAYARAKSEGYEIAKINDKDVGAVSFIFKKNPI